MNLRIPRLLLLSAINIINAGDKAKSLFISFSTENKNITVRVKNIKPEYAEFNKIRTHVDSCEECKTTLTEKTQGMPDSIVPDIWLCAVISNKAQTSNPFYPRPATAK